MAASWTYRPTAGPVKTLVGPVRGVDCSTGRTPRWLLPSLQGFEAPLRFAWRSDAARRKHTDSACAQARAHEGAQGRDSARRSSDGRECRRSQYAKRRLGGRMPTGGTPDIGKSRSIGGGAGSRKSVARSGMSQAARNRYDFNCMACLRVNVARPVPVSRLFTAPPRSTTMCGAC